MEDNFDYSKAYKVEINDGSINCIWFEEGGLQNMSEPMELWLTDGHDALIEFSNGKKMIISNSEWCCLMWL